MRLWRSAACYHSREKFSLPNLARNLVSAFWHQTRSTTGFGLLLASAVWHTRNSQKLHSPPGNVYQLEEAVLQTASYAAVNNRIHADDNRLFLQGFPQESKKTTNDDDDLVMKIELWLDLRKLFVRVCNEAHARTHSLVSLSMFVSFRRGPWDLHNAICELLFNQTRDILSIHAFHCIALTERRRADTTKWRFWWRLRLNTNRNHLFPHFFSLYVVEISKGQNLKSFVVVWRADIWTWQACLVENRAKCEQKAGKTIVASRLHTKIVNLISIELTSLFATGRRRRENASSRPDSL